ncbi:restriction endonuclease subunit S [Patescibacteria group bacterium]|nr:restriction endonuclease subunit S [Patescibacteria group bacterium]MBU1885727.1 restriction endonuclease subunit S [Patescibacteria group bacterium]
MKTNWQTKKLGEVCDVIAGQSPEGKFYNKSRNGLPFYQGKKEFGEELIGEPTTWTTKITKEALDGDILISVRAPVGPTNFATEKICIGRGLAAIRVGKNIDKYFLFNFLQLFKSEIIGNKGAVFDSISKTQIENIEIPFPPLPEQDRIVKILNEVFSKIKLAKKNTEENLQNSKELFESYLSDVFMNGGGDWETVELNKYVKFIDYRGRTPKKTPSGIKLITAKNIKKGFLQRLPEEFIHPDNYEAWMTRGIPHKGDVLFTTEAPLANVAQLDTDKKVAFAQRTIIFQPDLKKINQSFLKYLILSNPMQKKILEKGTGATVKGIKSRLLKKIQISFPPLTTQKRIISKLDILSKKTKNLEDIYQQKIDDLDELKKSVLQKAFAGEL